MSTATLRFENAFQQLLVHLATRFINQPVDQMDVALTEALRQIAEFLGSKRASINLFDDDQIRFTPLYQWTPPEDQRVYPFQETIPDRSRLRAILERGDAIIIPNRADLPADTELPALLAEYDIVALLVVPLRREGTLIGFVSTSWSTPQEIRPEIADLLRLVGEIFLNAVERKNNESRILKLNEALEERVQERTQELQRTNGQFQAEIRERIQVEELLRLSEERYRIVSELISDYAFVYRINPDASWTLEWITGDSYTRLTGYRVGEIGETFQLYHPEDEALARQDVERTLRGQPSEGEYRLVTKNGEVRWMYIRRYPLWDANHRRVERFYGVAQDITDRKRVEEQLAKERTLLQTVVDNLPDGIFAKDRQGRVILVNQADARSIGADSEKDLIGKTVYEYFPPEKAALSRAEEEALMESGRGIFNQEVSRLDLLGKLHWILMTRVPLRDTQGQVIGLLGITRDITDRKLAEEALRVSEERYRIVTELISDYAFVCSVSTDGQVTLEWITLDSVKRITGYTDEEISEQFRVYHPDDNERSRRDVERTIQGQSTDGEYRILTKAGDIRWLYIRRYPLWDAQHQRVERFYGVAQDITERKRIEMEEREQRVLTEALLDTADALNSTLDLDEVLDRILTNVERVAPHDGGVVMLIEEGVARVVRAKGANVAGWKESAEKVGFPLATTPNLLQVYETRQPLIIPDVRLYPDWVETSPNQWIRSDVSVPIQQGNEVIGFLSCDSVTPNFFAPKVLPGLQAFAHQTAIAITNAKLYQQAQELAVLQERQRLARDLHDAVTQTMFSASVIAETLTRQWERNPEQVRQGLTQLRHLTRGAVAEMRSLLLELRPEALDGLSLPHLLTQLAEAFTGQTGIIPTLALEGDRPLPPQVKITLYRVAQEAMNNVSKHARASALDVSLTFNDMVRLTVSDNGRGFAPDQKKAGSLGLKIMRERAEQIGARLAIDSKAGQTTTITVEWVG